jgi:SAM-dependent methyltransferase
MVRYALLLAPSANHVYAAQAPAMARAELTIFTTALDARLSDIGGAVVGGVDYLVFDAPSRLSARDVALVSNLSAAYALFEVVDDELLRPVALTPLARYDADLITIPKYAGKTNEQFTRLLLNVTVLAGASASRFLDGGIVVGDPLCGRGTTLNQALMYGYDGVGIEIDGKDVEIYLSFLKTWLKRKRLKHTAEFHPVRRDRRTVARRLEVTVAASRDDHRAGVTQKLVVLHADTTRADEILKPACVDVIATDLPYGVAHGSHGGERGVSRRPAELLAAGVPQWERLLRPGGSLGLSFNTRVSPRGEVAAIVADAGLEVVDAPGYDALLHRVDQTVERDVLVARKAG